MLLRAREWPCRDAAVRLKVEWVSLLGLLACSEMRFILEFNKLIIVIWQLVSSVLEGGFKAQFTIPFKSLFYYHADKVLDRLREGDECILKLLQRSHKTQRGQPEPEWSHSSCEKTPWSPTEGQLTAAVLASSGKVLKIQFSWHLTAISWAIMIFLITPLRKTAYYCDKLNSQSHL